MSSALKKSSGKPINLAKAFAAHEANRLAQHPAIHLNDTLGTLCVALSVVILAYSWLIPVAPMLLFLMLWFSVIFFKGWRVVRPSPSLAWVLALPLIAILSSLWSGYPGATLYLATGFVAMVLASVILHRVITFPALVRGIAIGISITLLVTLINGRYALDYLSKTEALVGLFGSKNTVGFLAEIGFLTSITLFAVARGLVARLLLVLLPILICILCLALSRSATTFMSLALAFGIMGVVWGLLKLPHQVRVVTLIAGFFVLTALMATGSISNGKDIVFAALGKNATMTGRTYLWNEGTKIGWEKPVLGHGYSAFWQHGEPRAEELWKQFSIESRTGFHFHSIFVQTFVDLGIAGLVLIILLMLLTLYHALRAAIRTRMGAEATWLLAMSVMFMTRAFVEVDFLGPFGIGVMLFYGLLIRISEHEKFAPKAAPTKAVRMSDNTR